MANFAFAVPVAPFRDATQWQHLNTMLSETLRSVFNSTNGNFRVLVAGHERPEALDLFNDPRLEFIEVAFGKPESSEEGRQDKRRKRWAIAARFREIGGGYFMYLDADDYIHRELTAYILDDDNKTGYFIPEGYALDYKNRVLAAIPGAWRKPFNHVCGSSGIIYFEERDLPARAYPSQKLRLDNYFKIRNHLSFEEVTLRDKPNAPVPFPAAIYNINNELNLSNDLVRTEERQQQLIDGIRKRQIKDTAQIAENFGLQNVS